MSIESDKDLLGITRISNVVALTLKGMREYTRAGMSTWELDQYGAGILKKYGARPAPALAYGFPGCTCISVNNEAAHGIPSQKTILKEGDLVNIDVSAELDGYYSDNGGSFVVGPDIRHLDPLVRASKDILYKAIHRVRGGVKVNEIGRIIETEAKKRGFKVIKNLCGHGVGRSLHEEPKEIPNFYDRFNTARFRKNSVVAIETFISTRASYTHAKGDGWTEMTGEGGFVAQHEHTIIVTDKDPVILTKANDIWMNHS